jgi:hypothetical protein
MADNKFSTSMSMGAYHIANNQIEYNPQRKSNFMLALGDFPTSAKLARLGAPEADLTDSDYIEGWKNNIVIALKSCDTPGFSQGTIEISRGNSKIKFPGKPTFKDISVSAYDYMGSDVKDTFLAWQNLSYNSTGDFIGNKSAYKIDCTLYEYTPAGQEVRHWDIKGAWLSEVNIDGFDTEDDGVAMINATIVYDWAQMKLPD